MEEAEDQGESVQPPSPPLFSLDLGVNGGVFAPTTVQEMRDWVHAEQRFWSWANKGRGGPKNVFDQAVQPLNAARDQADEAVRYSDGGNQSATSERIKNVENLLRQAFLNKQLPHSTTPLSARIAELKSEPRVALAYLFPFWSTELVGNHHFDVQDLESWRGFIMGMLDRFEIVTNVEPAIQAEKDALSNLRSRTESLLGTQGATADKLHRSFVSTTEAIEAASTQQQAAFDEFMEASRTAHNDAIAAHKGEMEALKTAFRESMRLRAPVEYWNTKAKTHETKAKLLMMWSFGSMAGLACALGAGAFWVLQGMGPDQKPDAWKLAVVALVGVLGVWAVRLIVRMYLSHTHLTTDAEERVTMVQTYLALLEGEKMPSDEDRKLVLAPLFRPATDGIVKDEGLPHPILEMFTRSGGR